MLLKPRNVKELVEHIKAIPEENRRVIVFAGRHINEGTRNLAVRHHKEWEEHGAATVLIPAHWTPEGHWRKIQRKIESGVNPSDPQLVKEAENVPEDDDLFKRLNEDGITAPIVNFHATKLFLKRGLVLYFPTHKKAEWEDKVSSDIGDQKGIEIKKTNYFIPDSTVLVEYIFKGQPNSRGTIRTALATKDVEQFNEQLARGYLWNAGRVKKEELDKFPKNYGKAFNALLASLAKHATRPKRK